MVNFLSLYNDNQNSSYLSNLTNKHWYAVRLGLFENFKSQGNLVNFQFWAWTDFWILKYQTVFGQLRLTKADRKCFFFSNGKLNLWCMLQYMLSFKSCR